MQCVRVVQPNGVKVNAALVIRRVFLQTEADEW